MSNSELVTTQHLARKAIIYIRQSTPNQVLTNQESLRLQYALKQRAISLGWQPEDIEVIDCDLGLTGAAAEHREGFKELVAKVTLGQVGIILSIEVARLSRNCSDWYPLLDICGWKGCLIADRDGIYDPATANGRMLLGLKGQLSEMELYSIRARLTAGLLNKAKRGELALRLPIGLERDENGSIMKTANLEVQNRIELVFNTFLELKTVGKVLRFFVEKALLLPRRDRFGDLVWRKPTSSSINCILKNPAYAGAFVYGKSKLMPKNPAQKNSARNYGPQRRLPMEQWKIRINGKYPAYISWETFEQIQNILKDNYAEYGRNKTRGIARGGASLLQGIVYCGECGHKMAVQYKFKSSMQYICASLKQKYGGKLCQNIAAKSIDAYVTETFFKALSPIELNAYQEALSAKKQTCEEIARAHAQQLERLRYQAALAQRQFNRADPDNRLVAAELEKRWETALRELKAAEEVQIQEQENNAVPFVLTAELKTAFSSICENLPQLWNQTVLSQEHRKAFLRCLIDKVVIQRNVADRVKIRIIWKGGLDTITELPVSVLALSQLQFAKEMEQIIVKLVAEGKTDAEIAQYLSAQGYRSARQQFVLKSTVTNIRLKYRLFHKVSQSHPRCVTGYLTVSQLAKKLSISRHWIHRRLNDGTIKIKKDPAREIWLFPDNPSTLKKFKQLRTGKLNSLHF
jgi:DNA invertase Pin-like site-specific DNA recombinase